jgi:hypothetical protein
MEIENMEKVTDGRLEALHAACPVKILADRTNLQISAVLVFQDCFQIPNQEVQIFACVTKRFAVI